MATAEAALEKMREICLSLPDTSEGVHFGQTAFHVKGKLWAICGDKYGVWQIAFGLELEHAAALAKNDPKFKLHPRDKRGVVVDVADVKSWGEIKALLLESYGRMTPQKKPAKGAAKKPAKGAAKKPAKGAAKKSAKGAAKKPAKGAAKKPAKGAAKKPAKAVKRSGRR